MDKCADKLLCVQKDFTYNLWTRWFLRSGVTDKCHSFVPCTGAAVTWPACKPPVSCKLANLAFSPPMAPGCPDSVNPNSVCMLTAVCCILPTVPAVADVGPVVGAVWLLATPTVLGSEFKGRDTFGATTCCPAPTTDCCPGVAETHKKSKTCYWIFNWTYLREKYIFYIKLTKYYILLSKYLIYTW